MALVATTDHDTARSLLSTSHPRQAYDERLFVASEGSNRPWSFDQAALDAAAALRQPPVAGEFCPAPLPEPDTTVPDSVRVVALDDLRRFLARPQRTFLVDRLQLSVLYDDDVLSDALPVGDDSLAAYAAGNRRLEALADGATDDAWRAAEIARGSVALNTRIRARLDAIAPDVDAVVGAGATLGVVPAGIATLELDAVLPDGTRVVGTVVDRLGGDEPGPAVVRYARAKAASLLGAWLDLLLLEAARPDVRWRSILVERAPSDSKETLSVQVLRFRPEILDRHSAALDALAVVVDLYRRALREPIPLFPETSRELHAGGNARSKWVAFNGSSERDDPSVVLAFGTLDYSDLVAIPARPDDPPGATPTRLERFAHYLWDAFDATVDPDGRDAGGAR